MHLEIYPVAAETSNSMLLASVQVPAGEPQDICTELEKIDLNEFITGGKDGVYLIRVVGDSMETDIRNGDLIIVNRNLAPNSGDIIVAAVNGAYTIKIYKPVRNGLFLVPANAKYKSKSISPRDDFEIFGVVTDVLHNLRK